MVTAKFNDEIRKYYPEKELANFDSRAWALSHDEVNNYFLWRQQDATKNSISMVARTHFSQKEIHGLDGKKLQDKLFLEKRINWNDIPIWQKRGVCITKQQFIKGETQRSKWEVDLNTPIFSLSREYINKYVYLNKDE
jgi:tRNA(His) 5'-end guanylyltransferase